MELAQHSAMLAPGPVGTHIEIQLKLPEECARQVEAAARLVLIGALRGEQAWVRLRYLRGRGSGIPCARPTEAYSGVPVRGTIS